MPDIIEPRLLKGFRDFLPEAESARSSLMRKLENVFSSFGFVPIDTPVLEYADILLGKGGGETDKQVYRFIDNGGRDVALRFDLTVPFARFMAQHTEDLYLPFRRYHMAKVWRGENTQRGRYREFMQCDFDIVGVDSASADADIVLVIASAMEALDVGGFIIRVNHRGLFNRFLSRLGVGEKGSAVLRLVDKMEKVGSAVTRESLAAEIGPDAADSVMEFIRREEGFEPTMDKLVRLCPEGDALAAEAGKRLREVFEIAEATGFSRSLSLDPSITRGLDYYTGIVFETTLQALPDIGSVCSGGRYNDLASLYTTKKLPGVGSAIGLDRLLAALEIIGRQEKLGGSPQVLIAHPEGASLPSLHTAAAGLRSLGVWAEVYPEPRKMQIHYAYAEKKGIPYLAQVDASFESSGLLSIRILAERRTLDPMDMKSVAAFLSKGST
ncbi:MAG TPA: histidine--tRNA ligase [Rectinemataceae bacterium]